MITSEKLNHPYFYIVPFGKSYTSTLKDARAVLKISKLCEFNWYEPRGVRNTEDTTAYAYLTYLKENSHGY